MAHNPEEKKGVAPGEQTARPVSRLIRYWDGMLALQPEGVLILAGILILAALFSVRSNIPPEFGWFTPVMTVLGTVVFLLGAQAASRRALPGWVAAALERMAGFLAVNPTQVIYLITSILLASIAAFSIDFGPLLDTVAATTLTWILAVLLAILGAWIPGEARLPQRRTMLWALALFSTAFAIRGISTANIPVTLTGDEASMGISALAFLNGEANNIFTIGWFSFPSLFYFLESLSIRLFGQTTEALRIPAALAGALTTAGVYFMGRAFFSRLVGALAAIFLAGFHFHVHFSRLGLNNIWDGLAFVITLGALWYGWKNQKRAFFILAAFWLGLAQYLYISSRVLFILIPLWLLITWVLDRNRFKENLGSIAAMTVVALVVIAPLAWYFLQNPQEFMAPLERVRLNSEWISARALEGQVSELRVLLDQVWLGLKAYTHEPIKAWYVPGSPLLRSMPAALFLLGLALLVTEVKEARSWMLLLWFLGISLSAGLSHDTPASQRYVAAAPMLALLVGYGVGETAARLANVWSRQKRIFAVAAILVVALLALDDMRFYFLEFTPESRKLPDNNLVAQRLADYLQTQDEDQVVYFFGFPRMGFYSLSSVPYLAPHIDGYDMNYPWGARENPQVTGDNLIFVFLPDKEADLRAVQAAYPDGQLVEEKTGQDVLVYWRYQVSSTR